MVLMFIVFLSNFFNHHQKGISDELYRKTDKFSFISTSEMSEERKLLGYHNGTSPCYVHKYSSEYKKQLRRDIRMCDVLIIGSAPAFLFFPHLLSPNKITIRYSERPFKTKSTLLKRIYRYFKYSVLRFIENNVFLLSAGAYTAGDYNQYSLYKETAFKWGYFPETKHYKIEDVIKNKHRRSILWCGRFIDWKHPDDAVYAARQLKSEGYEFTLTIVGTGSMEDELKALVKDFQLSDCVNFTGSMPPEAVRTYMESSEVFLFTSDKQEGWGAVLNEAMNSGCAVIASHEIGSVPYLIEHKKNGLIYESKNRNSLVDSIKFLLDKPQEQLKLGMSAYHTIVDLWNAEVATDRLLTLLQAVQDKKPLDLYQSGPCSRAEILKDGCLSELTGNSTL